MNKRNKLNRTFWKVARSVLILVSLLFSSCESFVDINPPVNLITSTNAFRIDATAIAAVTNTYSTISFSDPYLSASADELTIFDGVFDGLLIDIYRNELRSNSYPNVSYSPWASHFSKILSVNLALEELANSTSLSSSVKQQLLGECYFIRAILYFYLVNLYGDTPLALSSNPIINNSLSRASKAQVYEQLLSDLLKARELLNPAYVDKNMVPYTANAERVRPNRSAATALLARVYLYLGNRDAESEAASSEVINQSSLYELMPLNQVFLKNNKESIWQIPSVIPERNTNNGFNYILPASGPDGFSNPYYLNSLLLNAFEVGDQRAVNGNWVNKVTTSSGLTYYYPFKYKVKNSSNLTEYDVVLRLGEQYLIRAEARAKQGKLLGVNSAVSDLNLIRARAGLTGTTATTKDEILEAILKERRAELFTEGGHRWLDLKRTGKIDEVMSIATGAKGSVWQSYQQWYPIPLQDIQRGPNLKQNPGY